MVPVLLLAIALSPPGGVPVPLPQYAREVHAVRVELDHSVAPPSASALTGIEAKLRALSAVQMPDGQVIQTDLPLLAQQISPTDPASVRRAAATLAALDRALTPPSTRPADPLALARLDAVMKDPRFHPARPFWAPITDWIAQLRNRVIEWLYHQLNDRPGTFGGFGIVLVLLVAGLAYLLARGALARMVVDASEDSEGETPKTAGVADERSRAASAAGNYREALRYLFLATLLALQDRGAIELRPGLTNRDYVRQIRDLVPTEPALRSGLNELVETFDTVWYGHMPFGAVDLARMREVAAAIVGGAGQEAA